MYDFVVMDPRTAFVKLIFEARTDARRLVFEQYRNRDKSRLFPHSCRVYTYFKNRAVGSIWGITSKSEFEVHTITLQ